ncbi:MAG: phosphoglycerate dehydrogenase [Thermaerobacter sp.]|nr:phosphoglycerate dehydrogenase [Thermaerobacter sp.]
MMTKRPRVLVTEHLGDEGLKALRAEVDVEAYDLLPVDELPKLLPAFDAVIIRSAHRMTKDLLDLAPQLRVVARAGAGVDNIDLEAATARGVLALNTPGANAEAAAEHTFALLLALVRHVRISDQHVRAGGWNRQAFIGTELRGKSLGIIGIGRVGREVARIAKGFGMQTYAFDPYVAEETVRARGATKVETLEQLLHLSEVLTIHTPKTGPHLSRAELEKLPRGAFVLNVARGGLIDEDALQALCEEGHLAGSALDVFAHEPPSDARLLARDDMVFTCHLGGSTTEAMSSIGTRIAGAVVRALRGEIPEEAVNLPFPNVDGVVPAQLLQIGRTLGRIVAATGGEGPLLCVACRGGLPDEVAPITARAVLTGILERVVDGPVNPVNAVLRAQEAGLQVSINIEAGGPPRLAAWFAGEEERQVEVTVEHSPRIRRLAGGRFDLRLPRQLLVTQHKDLPGVVGRVGTLLGSAGINIATLELDREIAGGHALMALGLDDPVDETLLYSLRQLPEMQHIYTVGIAVVEEGARQ